MTNIECEKEFARRAALNPIASNSRELKMNDTVDKIIQSVMEKYPRDTLGSNAKYFEAVHQELAPFARELELQAALGALDAKRYRWLISQYWVQSEAEVRLNLLTDSNDYLSEVSEAIDAAIVRQSGETK